MTILMGAVLVVWEWKFCEICCKCGIVFFKIEQKLLLLRVIFVYKSKKKNSTRISKSEKRNNS